MKLTKVTISQSAHETVTPPRMEVLRQLKNIKTASSIQGVIRTTDVYTDTKNELTTSYPGLSIISTRTLVALVPEDAAVRSLLINGCSSPIVPGRYSEYEASRVETLSVFANGATTFTCNTSIRTFPEISCFTALTSIDLHGDTHLEYINASANKNVTTIDLHDTPAGIKLNGNTALTSLHLGSPTKLQIAGCTNLNLN